MLAASPTCWRDGQHVGKARNIHVKPSQHVGTVCPRLNDKHAEMFKLRLGMIITADWKLSVGHSERAGQVLGRALDIF